MDSNKLIDAARLVRRELLLKDEPIKAYNMLRKLDMKELEPELDKTYGMIRHVFEPELYEEIYKTAPLDDAHLIEPESVAINPSTKYDRYGWIMQELHDEKPESYMDLACYVGSLPIYAASIGINAYGVDMTDRAVEIAIERAKKSGLDKKATFFQGDVTKFDTVKADLVSAFEVFEHVPDPKAFVKHLLSIANKYVYLTTPDGPFGDGAGNLGHWEWDGKKMHTRGHITAWNKNTFKKLLEDCECKIHLFEAKPDGLLWAKVSR